MTEYVPNTFSGELSVESLLRYVEEELLTLSRSLQETLVVELRPIYVEPTKKRNGMVVYADGTSWNPGSGEGFYGYEAGAWVKL